MIQILYFSGTGNTAYIGKLIGEQLLAAGHDKNDIRIDSIETFDAKTAVYQVLVFGFPVYACSVPDFIEDFIQGLSLGHGKPVYLFTTKGFFSGSVLGDGGRLFALKGYVPAGYADVLMPGSDGLAFMKKSANYVTKIANTDFKDQPKVTKMVEQIMASTPTRQLYTTRIRDAIFGNTLKVLYPIFENRLRRKFRADDSCILCGKCETICPAGNITVGTSVEFGDHCYLCMRCVHHCPTEAIQIGRITVNKYRYHGPRGNFKP